jgi:hypothetical protein
MEAGMKKAARTSSPAPPTPFFCYVLMPFAKAFDRVYETILAACTEDDTKCKCDRVDKQIYQGTIMDQVFYQIKASDLIIADMTRDRPSVLYEVGYAHALGKPIVFITQSTHNIPFDVSPFHHIGYSPDLAHLPALKTQIQLRLKFYLTMSVKPTDLSGRWILVIFDPDTGGSTPLKPYKIDGYTIRQQGRSVEGSIKRVFGEGTSREYMFSGYTDGREIVYAFLSMSLDIHSWGCCSLERTGDHKYEGRYFWPQGKVRPKAISNSSYGEQIALIRSGDALNFLGSSIGKAARRAVKNWIVQA